jgi:type IV secretory pathway VirB4 component
VSQKRYKVAKMMLNTFVEENDIKKIVYIDGDTNNLNLNNLQYKKQRRIEITLPHGEIHIIDSEDYAEVCKRYKVNHKALIKCLNGFIKRTEGYAFRYIV